MKIVVLLIGFLIVLVTVQGQSAIILRNNSHLDLSIAPALAGSHNLANADFSLLQAQQEAWAYELELLQVERDTSILPGGDTAIVKTAIVANGDTLELGLKLFRNGAITQMEFGASLNPGISTWYSDGNFHELNGSFAGKNIQLKFRAENDDAGQNRDLLFVLHETPEYSIDSLDFADPNTLNVFAYNIQFLPLFIGGFDNNLRAGFLPDYMYENLDVVIFEEAFDPLALPILEPGMVAAGFPYKTSILNNYFPFNGGVIIFSRWPIVATDEYDFQLCGANSGDCFANKGIKYAAIDKLGKRYHLFGTHMDAGSDPDDLEAKNLQFAEMRDFIAAQNIPAHEPVIYAGDFNVGPLSSASLYPNMKDSLDPIIPDYTGYRSSTLDTITGHIIDHCWGDKRFLHPLDAVNEILILRGTADDLWEISDLSDHRTCWGRFSYPDISFSYADTSLCPGDAVTLSVSSNISLLYQWLKDGQPISGANNPSLNLTNLTYADVGHYTCNIQYHTSRGNLNNPVNNLISPNGQETLTADLDLEIADLSLDCGVAILETSSLSLEIFPNPSQNLLHLKFSEAVGKYQVSLWDARGNLSLEEMNVGQECSLDLEGLPAGIYHLQIQVGDGLIGKKIVKID